MTTQHDMAIANALFPATRADVNAALLALSTKQAGTSAPSLTAGAGPNSNWADQTNGILWQRDNGDLAWYPWESLARNRVNAQTGTTYTVLAADLGCLTTFNNASAIAVTLPQATGNFGGGWWGEFLNIGAGLVTITPTTSTIGGASSLTLATGQGLRVWSNGTNYYYVRDYTGAFTGDSGSGGYLGAVPAPAAGDAAANKFLKASGAWAVPTTLTVGTIFDYAGSSAPSGYLLCFGQNVSRTTYSALFAVISTTFGVGDGSTTFGIPDLRGRAAIGKDDMGGSAANRVTNAISGITGTTLGAAGGSQSMTAHTHPSASGSFVDSGAGTSWNTASSGGAIVMYLNGATGSRGAGAAENMPPALILNKIIYTGV